LMHIVMASDRRVVKISFEPLNETHQHFWLGMRQNNEAKPHLTLPSV
jgi:hypothetical protein